MCKCHERYTGEEGKKILEALAKKLKAAFNEDYVVQDKGNGSFYLKKIDSDNSSE